MGNFYNIQVKLQQFIKKYYTNELIKGIILFAAFGLLYLIFTLFIEYFLWLPPKSRTILFYAFIGVELLLLIKYIVIPLAKMLGVQKGLTQMDASKIIGKHFPEVDDKLLNVLQLYQNKEKSELLLASIEQKASNLKPIPFQRAINFKGNAKYLKYLSIPIIIWLFTSLTGNSSIFNDSLNRVVHYQTAYEPPAPFSFTINNNTLSTIEGKPFELEVKTIGTVIPENVQIFFNNENYFLKDKNSGVFTYGFSNVNEPITFYLEANGVRSRLYKLNVIKIPTIVDFEMYADYPAYTGKKDETIINTGNALIPEGTNITWHIKTKQTDTLTFFNGNQVPFKKIKENNFLITKKVANKLQYQISSSNQHLKDYEKLTYTIDVVKDEFPKINVKSDIDSVSRGPIQFAGQLSDDYGIKKLQLVYYNVENKTVSERKVLIAIQHSTFEEFYYIFSSDGLLDIKPGKTYQLYFEVFDNDGVNGSKSSKSSIFTYYDKTKQEINKDLLKEQKDNLNELNKTAKNSDKISKDFEEFSKKLKNKSDLNWNDKKEFDNFLKRQEQYQKMFQKQTDKLLDNLDEQDNNDASLQETKEELQKRIEEAKELQKRDELIKELQKMSKKLDKENMLQKLDKLTEKSKQEKRSLERLLELTKRFYVEQKAAQITQNLDSLANKQFKLSDSKDNNSQHQQQLNKQFQDIKKDFDELNEQNQDLFEPMNFPNTEQDKDVIDALQEKATDALNKQDVDTIENTKPENNQSKKTASLHQKAAAKKMKQLGKKLQGAMSAMQGQMINENIDDIKAILENLLAFSFDQEKLMLSYDGIDASSAEFAPKLKQQQILKENFEHIDDSLYVLSLRVQQLSSKIQSDLTEAHYNIDKSLENIADNRINQGISNQQYTMTAANNLADMLSDLLQSLQNPSQSKGQGKGKQPEFSLPDIIQKQKSLQQKLQQGMEQKKQGQGKQKMPEQSEEMNGEQYQIYQQQSELRKALQELIQQSGRSDKNGNAKEALKQMEELEKQLLDKGFTNEVLQNMLQLEYQLLKLDDATFQQGDDTKRKSETNTKQFSLQTIPSIKSQKLFFNTIEILNREPLPLRSDYKRKVQQYFNN